MVVNEEDTEKLLPYATNMSDIASSIIHKFYESRFGIIIQYQVKNKLR